MEQYKGNPSEYEGKLISENLILKRKDLSIFFNLIIPLFDFNMFDVEKP